MHEFVRSLEQADMLVSKLRSGSRCRGVVMGCDLNFELSAMIGEATGDRVVRCTGNNGERESLFVAVLVFS